MSMHDDQAPHRLFAAIVLMGTGLATGCGGISTGERHVDDGGGQATGGSGTAGSGVATPPGGATSTGSGGAIQIDPGPPTITPVKPGPFACPPQLWTCSTSQRGLAGDGWALQDDCQCDPARPRGPEDCPVGKAFTCQRAVSTADGRPLTEDVLMSCTCVDVGMYLCDDECDVAYGLHDLSCNGSDDRRSVSCGCAVVYLK